MEERELKIAQLDEEIATKTIILERLQQELTLTELKRRAINEELELLTLKDETAEESKTHKE